MIEGIAIVISLLLLLDACAVGIGSLLGILIFSLADLVPPIVGIVRYAWRALRAGSPAVRLALGILILMAVLFFLQHILGR